MLAGAVRFGLAPTTFLCQPRGASDGCFALRPAADDVKLLDGGLPRLAGRLPCGVSGRLRRWVAGGDPLTTREHNLQVFRFGGGANMWTADKPAYREPLN